MNYKMVSYFFMLIIGFLLSGCSSVNEPMPYQHTNEKFSYDKSIQVDIDKKNTKIFIDNRFDLDRKDRILQGIYNKLLNKEIKYEEEVYKDEQYNDLMFLGSNRIALKTKHSLNYCIFYCKNKFQPNQQNMKIVSDGIVIKGLTNMNGIFESYRYANYLNNIYGLGMLFKLDIDSLDNNIAYFKDEYLKKYSLKEPLEKELKKVGYIVTDKKEDADIVISVENLIYNHLKFVLNKIPYPINYLQQYDGLSQNINTDSYYQIPVNLLTINSFGNYLLENESIKNYIEQNKKVHGADQVGAAFAVLDALFGGQMTPYSTLNSIKIFKNKKEVGKILDLTVAKDNVMKMKDLNLYEKISYKFNEVLSDELIDELNTQAAKQVIEKIRFIEK
ncbi:MAG: hypothetical protein PHF17_06185 [Arcobacteraceae bacterium]|nr:hypothetical protein [Arcobacteraceae bacterium]